MTLRGCGFIVGLLVWAGVAQAEPVTFTATVDHDEVAIGEPVLYVLTLTRPEELAVAWPKVEAGLGEFELNDAGNASPSRRDGKVTEQRWYRLSCFAAGSHTISESVLTYQGADGADHEVRAHAVTITVTSLLPEKWETLDIRDAKPLIRIRRHGWCGWFLGALALAGAAAGWWWRVRRALPATPAPLRQAPHAIALEALERLRQEALPSRNAYEEYYVRVSDIVRSYIEARFGLRAPEMTTEEFLHLVSQGHALSFDHRSLLHAFLAHCDMVKFARYQPTTGEAGEAFDSARRFVQETVPTPEPESAEHPGGPRAS